MKKVITKPEPKKVRAPKKEVAYEKPVKLGEHGPAVLWICRMLQKNGSTVKLTDKFHIGVRSAVISFQKKNKMKPTGIVDKKTWDKLSK